VRRLLCDLRPGAENPLEPLPDRPEAPSITLPRDTSADLATGGNAAPGSAVDGDGMVKRRPAVIAGAPLACSRVAHRDGPVAGLARGREGHGG